MADLTELQAAGLEVGRLIARLRRFHDLFDELCCEARQDGYFNWVNAQWEKHLGWTAEELLAKKWIEFVHPDDKAATLDAGEIMRTKNVIGFVNRYAHKNGLVWLRLRWKTITYNGSGIAYAKAEIIGTEPANG